MQFEVSISVILEARGTDRWLETRQTRSLLEQHPLPTEPICEQQYQTHTPAAERVEADQAHAPEEQAEVVQGERGVEDRRGAECRPAERSGQEPNEQDDDRRVRGRREDDPRDAEEPVESEGHRAGLREGRNREEPDRREEVDGPADRKEHPQQWPSPVGRFGLESEGTAFGRHDCRLLQRGSC